MALLSSPIAHNHTHTPCSTLLLMCLCVNVSACKFVFVLVCLYAGGYSQLYESAAECYSVRG